MCQVRTVKVCKRNKISHILWHASFRSHICCLLRVWQPLPAVEMYNNFFSNLENLITAINSSLLNVTESVSQWVSQSVSDKHSQWSDSGPIIMIQVLHFPNWFAVFYLSVSKWPKWCHCVCISDSGCNWALTSNDSLQTDCSRFVKSSQFCAQSRIS